MGLYQFGVIRIPKDTLMVNFGNFYNITEIVHIANCHNGYLSKHRPKKLMSYGK